MHRITAIDYPVITLISKQEEYLLLGTAALPMFRRLQRVLFGTSHSISWSMTTLGASKREEWSHPAPSWSFWPCNPYCTSKWKNLGVLGRFVSLCHLVDISHDHISRSYACRWPRNDFWVVLYSYTVEGGLHYTADELKCKLRVIRDGRELTTSYNKKKPKKGFRSYILFICPYNALLLYHIISKGWGWHMWALCDRTCVRV